MLMKSAIHENILSANARVVKRFHTDNKIVTRTSVGAIVDFYWRFGFAVDFFSA